LVNVVSSPPAYTIEFSYVVLSGSACYYIGSRTATAKAGMIEAQSKLVLMDMRLAQRES
jgi:hypothetical protein